MSISRSALGVALAGGLFAGCIGDSSSDVSSAATQAAADGSSPRGAVFTTTADGSRVNANIYAAKTDVYLDGGPGNGAPSGAAALPAGDYYFQVTDPSGHVLLSSDALDCRRIHINGDGVIDQAFPGPGCQHVTGIDSDHASLGALTVQLMPYADTPNNGGEYKAWVTPVDAIGEHGSFVHNRSKTDNFKVRATSENPVCGDGHVDAGEQCDDGNTTNGDGCSATCQTESPPPTPCCGDGHVDAGEQCDDGNTTSGDGCSATCQTETPPVCGNEIVEPGEDCDDGNTAAGDGCDATCHFEPLCDLAPTYQLM